MPAIINDVNRDLTLGAGTLLLARLDANDNIIEDFRFIGNCPEITLTIETEKLEHFKSTKGINQKDAEVVTRVTRTSAVTCDTISEENIALFFFGSQGDLVNTAATIVAEVWNNAGIGKYHQLGATTVNPTGARKVALLGVAVKSTAAIPVTYVEGTDYEIDRELGLISVKAGGAILEGADLTVDYNTTTSTRKQVISGSDSGSTTVAVKYIADNPYGKNRDFFMPKVNLSPTGDLALIGTDDWATVGFELEILTPQSGVAIYVDSRPV